MDTTFRNHLYQISIIFLHFINSVSTPPDRRHMSFKLFFIKCTVCYNILCGIYRHLIDGRRSRPKNIVVGHSKKSVMSCSKGVYVPGLTQDNNIVMKHSHLFNVMYLVISTVHGTSSKKI